MNPIIREGLPGAELVEAGLRDLEAGADSVAALAVSMAATRLRAVGIQVPPTHLDRPAHRLYERLSRDDPRAAHSDYNALVRRIVSFARGAEHARAR
jgi:hypothetical protein